MSKNKGLSAKVIWTGYRSGDDLKGCYAAADIFVLPSMAENFGMGVTEAMAAGVPVIVSNRVGVADDVKRYNAGIVVELDAEQMALATLDLLGSRHRLMEMSEKAKKAAYQLYSGERVARLMLKAFEDILSQMRTPACAWQ